MFTGPNLTNQGLVFYYDIHNKQKSFKGQPTTNHTPLDVNLTRYNNPGFSGESINTGKVHPKFKTPIWKTSFIPQDSTKVPRLSSSEGFGCYHDMGTYMEAGKRYMASIMVKEGNSKIIDNLIRNSYSNISGWGQNGTAETKRYMGNGWWQLYTIYENTKTQYSLDGTTPLSTRYTSNNYTTFTFNTTEASTVVVESGTITPWQYVSFDDYRGTYHFENRVQNDYSSIGVTIVDWGIDSSMTKPSYSPVYNYPSPTTFKVFYKLDIGSTGGVDADVRMRTFTNGVATKLSDKKFWKVTFSPEQVSEGKENFCYWTAPMVHELPDTNIITPFQFTSGERSPTESLIDLANSTQMDISNISFDENAQPYFDGVGDKIFGPWPSKNNIDDDTTPRSWEVVVYPLSEISGRKGIFGHKTGTGCSYYCNGGIMINGNEWVFNWYDNSAYKWLSSGVTAQPDQYTHIICTYDSDRIPRIYINGELKATHTEPTNLSYGSGMSHYDVGWNSKDGGKEYFHGKIPFLKFYKNNALTPQQVKRNFRGLRSRFNI